MKIKFPLLILVVLLAVFSSATAGLLSVAWDSASQVPITAHGYTPNASITFNLYFAPPIGTNLTVVRNTGSNFINGAFSNLAQGQRVTLNFHGVSYDFVANYFGGTGNDLMLVWQGNRAVSWGFNDAGQLGDSTTITRLAPGPVNNTAGLSVLSGKTVLATAEGAHHSVALCSDGTVAAWGDNSFGQLGDNTTTDRRVPVAVSKTSGLSALFGKTVVAVAAGEFFSLALCSDGTVAAWGRNADGQLGDNTTTTRRVPVLVSRTSGLSALFGKTAVSISAGSAHSLALCADGTLAAWGDNGIGQLGDNTMTDRPAPVAANTVSGTSALFGKTVAGVAAGARHSLALCSDGTVAAWGYNQYGQLGDNSATARSAPVAVNNASGSILFGKTVTAISAGVYHSLAVCSDGTMGAWGRNNYGQLGDGSKTEQHIPVKVAVPFVLTGKTVVDIAAGFYHSLAYCLDGTVVSWGYNTSGQLGDNTSIQRLAPVAVSTAGLASGERFVQVSSGPHALHSLALVATVPSLEEFTTGTLLSNGSFETGNFTDWILSDIAGPFRSLQVRTNGSGPGDDLFSNVATDGAYSAVHGFDGDGPGVIRMAHEITVTGAEPFLRFDYRAAWDMVPYGATEARTFEVTIEPSGGGPKLSGVVLLTAAPGTQNLDTGSLKGTVDLSAYIGTRIRVCFDAIILESNTGPGLFQLDNVRTASSFRRNVGQLTPGTLVSNGSFESGDFINWVVSNISSPFQPLGVRPDGYNVGYGFFSSAATDGAYSAVHGFDGAGPGMIRLAHEIAVSAAEPFLRFDYRAGWDLQNFGNATQAKTFAVTVEPSGGGAALRGAILLTAAPGTQNLDTGPMSAAIDLSAYIGTTVRVSFDASVPQDHIGPGFLQLDNVRTAALAPPLITGPATTVTFTTATLNGSVNAIGGTLNVSFEYGPDTGYGSTATASPSPVTGTTVTAVSAALEGLAPGTTYHYRIRAVNNVGHGTVVTGSDRTFTTLTAAEEWRQRWFGTTANAGDAADDADPNQNGIVNLLEYALVGNPVDQSLGMSILPQVGRSAANTLQITFYRFTDRTDVRLSVWAADDLSGPWTPIAESVGGAPFIVLIEPATVDETGVGNFRTVIVTDPFLLTDPDHPQRFMKLNVTRQ